MKKKKDSYKAYHANFKNKEGVVTFCQTSRDVKANFLLLKWNQSEILAKKMILLRV